METDRLRYVNVIISHPFLYTRSMYHSYNCHLKPRRYRVIIFNNFIITLYKVHQEDIPSINFS